MKEWCLKHPWMTFFLIDWIVCDICNAVVERKSISSIDRFGEAVGTVLDGIGDIRKKVESAEKQPIGFRAS